MCASQCEMRTVFQVAARLFRRLFMSDDDFICNIFIVLRPSQPKPYAKKTTHLKKINTDLEEEKKIRRACDFVAL